MPDAVSKVVRELLWFFYGLRQPRSHGLLSSRPPGAIEETLGTKSRSSFINYFRTQIPLCWTMSKHVIYHGQYGPQAMTTATPSTTPSKKNELIFYFRNSQLPKFDQCELVAELVQAKYENTKNYPPSFAVSEIRRAIAVVVYVSSLVATDLKP